MPKSWKSLSRWTKLRSSTPNYSGPRCYAKLECSMSTDLTGTSLNAYNIPSARTSVSFGVQTTLQSGKSWNDMWDPNQLPELITFRKRERVIATIRQSVTNIEVKQPQGCTSTPIEHRVYPCTVHPISQKTESWWWCNSPDAVKAEIRDACTVTTKRSHLLQISYSPGVYSPLTAIKHPHVCHARALRRHGAKTPINDHAGDDGRLPETHFEDSWSRPFSGADFLYQTKAIAKAHRPTVFNLHPQMEDSNLKQQEECGFGASISGIETNYGQKLYIKPEEKKHKQLEKDLQRETIKLIRQERYWSFAVQPQDSLEVGTQRNIHVEDVKIETMINWKGKVRVSHDYAKSDQIYEKAIRNQIHVGEPPGLD